MRLGSNLYSRALPGWLPLAKGLGGLTFVPFDGKITGVVVEATGCEGVAQTVLFDGTFTVPQSPCGFSLKRHNTNNS